MKKLIILLIVFCLASNIVFAASVGEWTKLKKGYIIAASQELFDRAVEIARSDDEETLRRLTLGGSVMTTGGIMQVYVLNIHPFAGTAEVKFRGDPTIWWISIEAIRDNQSESLRQHQDNKFYPQADTKNEYYLIEFKDGTKKEISFEEKIDRTWRDVCADFGKKTTEIKSTKIIQKE